MAIVQDFTYNFGGFGGYPSRCHIRVLDEPDKPLVVICSQLAKNPGTSVTNATEMIAQSVQDYLSRDNLSLSAAIQQYIKTSKLTKILGDLVVRLKDSKNLTVFTLESIKLALEYRELHSSRSNKIAEMFWVEHYDASIGLSPKCEYLEISFDPGTWTPNWECTTPTALSNKTGYPIAEFQIPAAVINQP
ncbi:MAG: hypothetical protein KBE25_03175 [Laribacter sp.]|nr:hypothetical protein [Laribacter sp.]MBP9608337.1 hypothetical protein [Laribacter sp.]